MQMFEPGQFATFGVNATSPMAFDFTMNSSISPDDPFEHFLNLPPPPNQTNQISAIQLNRLGLVQDLRPASEILPSPSPFHSNLSQQDVTSVKQIDFGYQHEPTDSGQLFAKHVSSVDSLSLSPASTNLFTPGTTSSPEEMDTNNGKEPQHPCNKGCSRFFKSSKDLHRHYKSRAHIRSSTKVFRCRCGYTNARKDHYRRHLQQHSCTFRYTHYRCICSQIVPDDNILQHLEHIRVCKEGQGRSGRPRKSEQQVSLGGTPSK